MSDVSRSPEQVSALIKAYDVRGLVDVHLDEGFARDVGGSFARLMAAEGATEIVVGYDMRDSSPRLSAAFAEGVTGQGLDVVVIGLASTDCLYYASGAGDRPGAMFTASHNPAAYNGIKLCRAGAKPVGMDSGLATIAAEVTAGVPAGPGGGTVRSEDVLAGYGEFLHELAPVPTRRALSVAVDAGNGMGGLTVPAVLGPLPTLTVHALYFELDGTFPNHEANPLDPRNLVDLQRFVVDTGADIGLAFDGDADRCFVVDERGVAVSASAITALVAERELARVPGATILHNLITSHAVREIIEENGGVPERTRVGHSYIKERMAATGAVFGGEHSAHYYFRDFFGADSGMLAALHVLAALAESDGTVSELVARYSRYAASGEINSTVADPDATVAAVIDAFATDTTAVDRLDGVTVELADGSWFSLRASNTEPLLRLNVEAADEATVSALVDKILAIVRAG